jgi:nitrite reductase/ring-hydroxylating ferredoxin subunit
MSSAPDPPHFDTGLLPDQVSGGRGMPVETPWGIFAIYQTAAGLRAAEAFCPHMDGPLFEGTQCDGSIVCPWHQWRFDLSTGACSDAAGKRIDASPIQCLDVDIGPMGTLLLSLKPNG